MTNHLTQNVAAIPFLWVLVTGMAGLFRTGLFKGAGAKQEEGRDVRIWTDDYSNLFKVLK